MRFLLPACLIVGLALLPLRAADDPLPPALQQATGELQEGNAAKAEQTLTAFLEREPGHRKARLMRAGIYAMLGQPEEVAKDCEALLAVNASDGEALAMRGMSRLQLKQTAAALADLDQAVKLSPNLVSAWRWRGSARQERNDLRGAEADYTRALELAPRDVETLILRADVRRVDNNYVGALRDLNEMLALAPNDFRARAVRGEVWMRQGKFREALEDAGLAVRGAPSWPHAVRLRATAFLANGDWGSAVADLRTTLLLDPSEADYARLSIWVAQIRGGEVAAAEREMREFAERRNDVAGDDWSARLIRFAAGELPEEDILKAPASLRGRASTEGQATEANFYAAVRRLAVDDRAGAVRLMRKAATSKAQDYIENQLARAFLPQLEKAGKSKARKDDPKAPKPKGGGVRRETPV